MTSEPLTPAQLSLEDGHDAITASDFCNAFDKIDDMDFDVNQNELDEILQDDVKFENNTLHEAKENELSLSVEEITYRLSKEHEHKLRCDTSASNDDSFLWLHVEHYL